MFISNEGPFPQIETCPWSGKKNRRDSIVNQIPTLLTRGEKQTKKNKQNPHNPLPTVSSYSKAGPSTVSAEHFVTFMWDYNAKPVASISNRIPWIFS